MDKKVIPESRKQVLLPLVDYIRSKMAEGQPIRIIFICTHNSRRSHLAQVWMQTLVHYNGLSEVFCYSGGTEETAVYPMIISILKNMGFSIDLLACTDNPVFAIKWADNESPLMLFSKRFDHFVNPVSDFTAVMTCAQADEECPFIPGADQRISIPYEDPKAFDDTPDQVQMYLERSIQIAAEMSYVIRKSLVS